MGAYFTNRQGETRWVADDAEWQRLEDAEWGGGGDSSTSSTATEEKPKEEEATDTYTPGEYNNLSIENPQIAENQKLLDKFPNRKEFIEKGVLKTKVPDKWSDVGTQIMQKIKPTDERAALIEKNKEDDPLLDDEFPKALARTAQYPLNSVLAISQQLMGEGYLDPRYVAEKIGLGHLAGELSEGDERNFKRYDLNREAIKGTGRFPSGDRPGYPQGAPLGKYLSNDSPWVQKNLIPDSELMDLGAQVAGAIGTGGLIRKFITRGPAALTAFKSPLPKGRIMGVMALFLREAAEDTVLFQPEVPDQHPELEPLYKAYKEATPDQQLKIAETIVSTNPLQFNYHMEQLRAAMVGGSMVVGLKGTWKLFEKMIGGAWNARKLIKLGTPVEEALEQSYKQLELDIQADVEEIVKEGVEESLEKNIGRTTYDYDVQIGETLTEAATKARESGESFLVKTDNSLKVQNEAAQNIDLDSVSLPEQRIELTNELRDIKKALNVDSPASIRQKAKILDARVTANNKAIKKDPNYLKGGRASGGTRGRTSRQISDDNLRKAIVKLQRLEELEGKLEDLRLKEEKLLQDNVSYVNAKNQQEAAPLAFQKTVNEIRDKVIKNDETLSERSGYVEATGRQDTFNSSAPVRYNDELRGLLDEAQEAIDNNQLDPEFMTDWVSRVEDVYNRSVEEGISAAPIKPIGEEEAVEGLLGPKAEPPLQTPVPLDKEGLIDNDLINQGINLSSTPPRKIPRTTNVLEETQQEIGKGLPAKSIEEVDELVKGIDEYADKIEEWTALDKKNGTNNVEENLEIFRATSAPIYTADLSDASLLKLIHDRRKTRGSIEGIAQKTILELTPFLKDPQGARQLGFLAREGMIWKQNLQKLSNVSVALSLLEANTTNAMQALQRVKAIQRGRDKSMSLEEAMTVALDSVGRLKNSIATVDPMAQFLGTALGLFRRSVRVRMPTDAELKRLDFTKPLKGQEVWKAIGNDWNRKLAGLEDADALNDKIVTAAQNARESFEETMGVTLQKLKKGESLSDDEFAKAMSVIDAVHKTGGNWNKISEIDKTWRGVTAQIITSGTLSNVGGPLGIAVANFSQAIPYHVGTVVMGKMTSKFFRWAMKESLADDIAKNADLHDKWLRGYLYGFMNSAEEFRTKMIFPDAHPDYVSKHTSLINQQAKLDDLASTEMKVPFTDWVLKRKDGPKVFDAINYGRVWFKSMHDNIMPFDDWDKLHPLQRGWRATELGVGKLRLPYAKKIDKFLGGQPVVPGLGAPFSAARYLSGGNLGKKPYYAAGQDQAMSAVLKSLSWSDGAFTSISGNGWFRAKIEQQLAEDVAEGLVKREDMSTVLKERLDKSTSELFNPIRAGIDQQTIGYEIRDKQFQSFKELITLTEELNDGGFGDMKQAIDTMKNSSNPYLSLIATSLFPVTTSAFNWTKHYTRYISGFEAARGLYDVSRLGVKVAREKVGEFITKDSVDMMRKTPEGQATLKAAEDFESVYLSEDPVIRERAQAALGVTIAQHAAAFAIVNWGGNAGWEVTGPMTHTFREGRGIKLPFYLRLEMPGFDFPGVDAVEIPLLYLGTFGATVALHAIHRDLNQFSNKNYMTDAFTLGIAAQSRFTMELPTFTGPDKFTELLTRAGDGDFRPIQRYVADVAAKMGSPFRGYEQTASRLAFKYKPADPLGGPLATQKWFKKGSTWEGTQNVLGGTWDTIIGTFGYRFEDVGVSQLVNGMLDVFYEDRNYWEASRMAMPFGEPGELIPFYDLPRLGFPLQAATGRFFPINSRVDDNKVRKAVLDNLIPPIGPDIFSSESDGGVGLSPAVVNELNHFLNEDALFPDPFIETKTHVGIHSFIMSIINSPNYKSLSGSDVVSPYVTGNWDRENSDRANWIKGLIRDSINVVKWQWLNGSETPSWIPDPKAPDGKRKQRWFADPKLRDLILKRQDNFSSMAPK